MPWSVAVAKVDRPGAIALAFRLVVTPVTSSTRKAMQPPATRVPVPVALAR